MIWLDRDISLLASERRTIRNARITYSNSKTTTQQTIMINKTLNYLLIFLLTFILASPSFAIKNDNSEIVTLLKPYFITIVAPASGNKDAISKLTSIKDVNLNIPTQCFASPTAFHSASDDIRFNCFKAALSDNSSVIWALRGGYGSAKIIADLKNLPKPEKEKLFIGYSDNTALHLFLTQEWGWKTIHGSGIAEIITPKEKSRKNFVKIDQIISGKTTRAKIDGLIPMNDEAKTLESITSSLTGGNLTIVETSIGTSWHIISKNKILFLEDVNITPYILDRSLLHLKQAGVLKEVEAIIFGDINDNNADILSVILNFAKSINIPIFKCDKFGHRKINDPIIYNTKSVVSKEGNSYSLIMER